MRMRLLTRQAVLCCLLVSVLLYASCAPQPPTPTTIPAPIPTLSLEELRRSLESLTASQKSVFEKRVLIEPDLAAQERLIELYLGGNDDPPPLPVPTGVATEGRPPWFPDDLDTEWDRFLQRRSWPFRAWDEAGQLPDSESFQEYLTFGVQDMHHLWIELPEGESRDTVQRILEDYLSWMQQNQLERPASVLMDFPQFK
jgi:hypothetical protein